MMYVNLLNIYHLLTLHTQYMHLYFFIHIYFSMHSNLNNRLFYYQYSTKFIVTIKNDYNLTMTIVILTLYIFVQDKRQNISDY